MSRRRLLAGSIVPIVVVLLGVTADAQFPKIRIPKTPAIPGVNRPSPPAPAATQSSQKSFECSDITDELVENMLKGREAASKAYEAAQKAYDAEMARAKAKRAEADALQSNRGQQMMNVMMQNSECKDAFKKKDPRASEIARLEDQVAAADSAGDGTKSDAVRKKL